MQDSSAALARDSAALARWRAQNWRRNQIGILTVAGVAHVGFNLAMPFLPLYLPELGVTDPGLAALWTGAIIGVTPLIAAVAAPFWGMVADRTGTKRMIQRAIAAGVPIFLLMALASSPEQLFILRASFGFVSGFGPLLVALSAISAPQGRRGEAVGLTQGFQLASIAVGPILGGVLSGAIGYRYAFAATAASYVIALMALALLVREPPRALTTAPADLVAVARRPTLRRWRLALPRGQDATILGALAVALFLSQLVERAMGPILPLIVAELDVPRNTVASLAGLLVGLGGLASAISATMLGRATRRVSPLTLLVISTGGAALFTFLLTTANTFPLLLLWRGGMALLLGGTASLCYGAAAVGAAEGRTASRLGTLSSAALMATGLGPLSAGVLGLIDLRAAFAVGSVVLLLTSIFTASVLRPLVHRSAASSA